MDRNQICKACDGTGLLADDENWQYSCTVCGGDGVLLLGESPERSAFFSVDENNRTME
ncbi:hypothetical protein [Paenibacillus senegalensis]|uniref:hypothetical protein n=1 Tax=Paenibacillus senegalensis TaxID=1465766 RepID=UPI00028A1151|nr:hypothetical protein [Paenibacillus senegalensis]